MINIEALQQPLKEDEIKYRQQGGIEIAYLEGWRVIEKANQIFGYDGWNFFLKDLKLLKTDEIEEADPRTGEVKKYFYAEALALARVEVWNGERFVIREDVGVGSGKSLRYYDAVNVAAKEAATDALKRAFRTWGDQFGNRLYSKEGNGEAAPLTEKQKNYIEFLAKDKGVNLEALLKKKGKENLDELTKEEAKKLIDWLQKQ